MRLFDLFYPTLCLHCGDLSEALFCKSCQTLIELLEPKDRCVTCFGEKEDGTLTCKSCRFEREEVVMMGALFEYLGPMMSLTRSLKFKKMGYLAKNVAPFFVVQLEKIGWEWPDLVTYVPRNWFKNLLRGYNQSYLLARAFCQLTRLPLLPLLKQKGESFSQIKLSKKERRKLPVSQFQLKKGGSLFGKNILIIDDVITTGATGRACAAVLRGGDPKEIRVMALCRAGSKDS
ncbi:MAG: ComF family protein [Chlamydiia bacterium]|nr:ComF family protein [Chlamydiia bacterium]